jgi:hypothetical protein
LKASQYRVISLTFGFLCIGADLKQGNALAEDAAPGVSAREKLQATAYMAL